MSPGSGTSGTTAVTIQPYEENIYDNPITGYVQLEDTGDLGVVTIIRWRQKPKGKEISVSGSITGAPVGSVLYIERPSDTGSVSIGQDTTSYSVKVPADTPFRLYMNYLGETIYNKSFNGSSADVVNDISITYEYSITYETDLPKDGEYIVVD